MELGGNITLAGFNEHEFAELIVVKKVVGQYARRLHDTVAGFEHLSITNKSVGTGKTELHATCMVSGKMLNAEVTESNLFVGIDKVLKKILAQT